jgi:hypothetical protein
MSSASATPATRGRNARTVKVPVGQGVDGMDRRT